MSHRITFPECPECFGLIRWYTDTPEATLLGASDTQGTVEIPEDSVCYIWLDTPPLSFEFLRDCPDIKINLLQIEGHHGQLDLTPIRALNNLRRLNLSYFEMSQKAWNNLACSSLEEIDIWGSPLKDISLKFLRNFPKLKRLTLHMCDLFQKHLLQLNKLEDLVFLKIWPPQSPLAYPTRSNLADIASLHSLRNLEELEIYHPHFTDDFFEYLAPFPRLRSLTCRGETFAQNAISNLLAHCPISELFLTSTTNQGTLSGLDTVSQVPLQSLALNNFHLDDAGIQTVSHHKSLESISLSPANIKMRPLSLNPLTSLPNLTSLGLSNILVEEPNIISNIPSLQQLILHQSMERPNTPSHRVPILGRPLVSSPVWQEIGELPHLRKLRIDGTFLRNEEFVSLKNLGELEYLWLWEYTLTPEGLVALKECKNLSSLVMHVEYLSPNIIKHLSKLPRLKEMRTYTTDLRPKELSVLCELQNLRLFTTDYHLIFPEPLESIKKCLPHCYIQHNTS